MGVHIRGANGSSGAVGLCHAFTVVSVFEFRHEEPTCIVIFMPQAAATLELGGDTTLFHFVAETLFVAFYWGEVMRLKKREGDGLISGHLTPRFVEEGPMRKSVMEG